MTGKWRQTQSCCTYQICSRHLSKGQTLWTDQNMVLLFINTHLRQNEQIIKIQNVSISFCLSETDIYVFLTHMLPLEECFPHKYLSWSKSLLKSIDVTEDQICTLKSSECCISSYSEQGDQLYRFQGTENSEPQKKSSLHSDKLCGLIQLTF